LVEADNRSRHFEVSGHGLASPDAVVHDYVGRSRYMGIVSKPLAVVTCPT
jgi:hypothetical protein